MPLRMNAKTVAVFLVTPSMAATNWLCELEELWLGLRLGQLWLGLRLGQRVMARAKARAKSYG